MSEKKRKEDLKKKLDVLEMQIQEAYKHAQTMINHFAQNNPSKFKHFLSVVFEQHQTLKEDAVSDKVYIELLNYFGFASGRISVEKNIELTHCLKQIMLKYAQQNKRKN